MHLRGQRRSEIAAALDVAWLLALVVGTARHEFFVLAGVPIVALAVAATRVRRLGTVMVVPRLMGALLMLVVAATTTTAMLVFAVAAAASAAIGFNDARMAALDRRPRCVRSTRFDEIGAAVLHFGFVGFLVGGILAERRFAAAAGFLVAWVALTWGTIGVHEAGHAIAAMGTGNDVPEIHVGVGLTVLQIGRVRVGAIPFLGHTHWAPDESTMTSRREAIIALSGPFANLLAAALLLGVPILRESGAGGMLAVAHLAAAALNLYPFERVVHGRTIASDGARARRLLRRPALNV